MPHGNENCEPASSADTIINETESNLGTGRETGPRWMVFKISFAEKVIVLQMFMELKVVDKRGLELFECFDDIAAAMKERQVVRASTRAAITLRSAETYQRNYSQPLLNCVKRGGPFMRNKDGSLQLDEDGNRFIDELETKKIRETHAR